MASRGSAPFQRKIAGRADVLIVGAGPAGCMAAMTLARYGINICIFDKNALRTQTGHASAFQPRTQEILQTVGMRQKLDDLGHRLTETSFWRSDDSGLIVRVKTGSEVVNPTPYQYMFNTDQGLTEKTFEEELAKAGYSVHRLMEFIDYEVNPDMEWPLTVHMKNIVSGSTESWLAKYLLGADGSRSATRFAIGAQTTSNNTQDTWAVADVLLNTDFPDRRRRCAIRTAFGSCMLIPRKDEGMRIFLQLNHEQVSQLGADNIASKNKSSHGLRDTEAFQLLDIVQSQVQKILHPYSICFRDIIWLSRYKVAQRIVDRFSDSSSRVFLLGDACHTHSPKAGQGMNVSICDAYNLTWKLALVLKGKAKLNLLQTYEHERRHIAQLLIAFDTKFAALFGERDNLDSSDLHDLWEEGHGFASGCGYTYPEGLLVDNLSGVEVDSHASEPLLPGKRLLDIPLIRHIDGTITSILCDMPSNGRFHLFVLAGSLLDSAHFTYLAREVEDATRCLNPADSPAGDIFHHEDMTTLPPLANRGVVLDIFLIHTDDHSCRDLDSLQKPFSNTWQSRVYEDRNGQGHRKWGIDPGVGCLALVRPDGYISKLARLDAVREILTFLDHFLQ